MDSAIGLSLVVAVGPERFAELLAGFHAMDEHFRTAPPESNVPLRMGLLNVWYTNFLGAHTHAVLPYAQLLHRFPAYLQQLTMESNGKGVRWDGSAVGYDTGEVFWGEPGTNGQHAFYQLIHQGTRLVPADFIAFARPSYELVDRTDDGETDVHELLLANFLAQTKALAFGKSADEVRAEGVAEELVPARTFPGTARRRRSWRRQLTPSVLGQLIALYEHITFVAGRRVGHRQLRPVGRRARQAARPGAAARDSGDDVRGRRAGPLHAVAHPLLPRTEPRPMTTYPTPTHPQDRRLPRIAGPCGMVLFGVTGACPARR